MQVCSILLRAHSPPSIQNEAARIPPLSLSFRHPELIRTAAARRSSENSTVVFPVPTLRAHSRSSAQTKTVIIPPPSSLCPHIPASPVTLAAQSSVIPTALLLPYSLQLLRWRPTLWQEVASYPTASSPCPYNLPIPSCSHHPATHAGCYHCLFCSKVYIYFV